jgi:hypothetical protein
MTPYFASNSLTLDRDRPAGKTVTAIPTPRMDAYIAEMRRRLVAKQIGAKREFLQEVVKEVRVRGSAITLTYKLPLKTLRPGSLQH